MCQALRCVFSEVRAHRAHSSTPEALVEQRTCASHVLRWGMRLRCSRHSASDSQYALGTPESAEGTKSSALAPKPWRRSRRCKVEPRADKDDVMCASIQASRGSWNTGRRDCFCTLSPIAVGRVRGTINRSIINASAAFSRFLIPDWHPAPALLRPKSCPSTPRPRAG